MTEKLSSRPRPRPSRLARPFWDAAHRGQLIVQRCGRCERHVFYPRFNCPHCGATDLDWVDASGRATVFSFTVARRPTHPAFAGQVPYVIAIVELEEGPRMTTNIVGCVPEAVRIGMAVVAEFEPVDEDTSVVVFRPDTTR